MFMPANPAVGQATEKKPTKDPAPNIACAPGPYALRTTTLNNGVGILAPTLNSLVHWRTNAVRSNSGPTMIPGQSMS